MHSTTARLFLGLGLLLPGPSWADDYEAGQIVVNLMPGHTIEEVNANWGTTTLDAYPEGNLYLLDATDLGDVESLSEEMESDPAIDEAEANYFQETPEGIRAMVVVIVGGGYVDYEDQLIGSRIGLDQAHQITRGAGVTVAVLDTGVDPAHEAFQGRISPLAHDFVDDDDSPWEEANGLDDDLDQLTDEGYGHGTMVAGIVALVAPEATLLPVRVLTDEGNGDAYRIAKGISYAVHNGAGVVNLSFGIPRTISIIGHQVAIARAMGAVVVAGAGNENMEQAYYPAAHQDAEMVTAVDSLDIKAGFADWDSKVFVSAPGTGVRSSYPGGVWAMGDGCSFATPFVSGEAALIRSLRPLDPPDDVRARIGAGVHAIDQLPGNEPYEGKLGSGRIHIPSALVLPAEVAIPIVSNDRLIAAPNPVTGRVRLLGPVPLGAFEARVLDASGRVVRILERSDAPVWDGLGSDSRRVASGVYFVRMVGRDREFVTTIHLLR